MQVKLITTEYFTISVKWLLGLLAPNRNTRLGYRGINLTGTGSTLVFLGK
jgi:hypothetical protein